MNPTPASAETTGTATATVLAAVDGPPTAGTTAATADGPSTAEPTVPRQYPGPHAQPRPQAPAHAAPLAGPQ
ncbi:hypothetical protein ACFV3S_38285, partial [Streptomyces sp. NPDC059749]